MAMAPAADPRRRPLSVPAQGQAQAEFPPPYTTTTTTTTTTKPTPRSSSLSSSHVRGRPALDANANADADSDSCTEPETDTPESSPLAAAAAAAAAPAAASPPPPVPSILQPRVAVVLKVPPRWHSWLFFFRLCSILPAAWWGLPSLLRLLLHFLPGPPPGRFSLVPPCASLSHDLASSSFFVADGAAVQCAVHNQHHHYHDQSAAAGAVAAAASYAMTETMLATIWCFACGYLSFFFTDCLMSRWLIHYTPQATIVRLLSINAVSAYLTLSVLSFTGGFDDSRLLLPGWVAIATTLTVCYHITHQKINIRKETSTSVNVFSIASYITMVVLLVHMQAYQADYPTMPVVVRGRQVWQQAMDVVARITYLIQERADLREEM